MIGLQRWGRWLALALVAVLNAPLFSEERELPRELLLVAIAAVGLRARLRSGALLIDRRWSLAALLFGAVAVVEAFFAESPGRSLFGPYEGHQGALAWCAALMLMASTPGPATRRDACAVLFGLGLLEAGLALRQFAADAPPTGTLGHAMFLSILLTLAALAGFGLLLESPSSLARLVLTVGLPFLVLVEVLAARRMPLAALAVGVLVMAVRSAERRRLGVALALALGALVIGARIHRPASSDFLAERVTSAFDLAATYGGPAERLDFYRVAWNAWQERPLVGWGFGAFRDLYASRKAPGITRFEARVHDLPLELLLALGLVGMLAFLPLVVRSVRLWGRSWRTASEGTQLACLAAGLAYPLCLMTNFDQPGVAAWGFTLAAFPLLDAPWSPVHPLRWSVVAVGVVLGWVPSAAGDALARWGVDLEQRGEREAALQTFRRAVEVAPFEELYRLRLTLSLRAASRTGTAAERLALLEAGLAAAPRSPFLHEHRAIALADAGRAAEGLAERQRAVELAPGFAPFHDGLARAWFEAGQAPRALDELDEAVKLEPFWGAWLNDRANVLRSLGRVAEARRDYEAALAKEPRNEEIRRNLHLLDAARP